MINKIEIFKADSNDIDKKDIENLIDYVKHVSITYNSYDYKTIIKLEIPFPIRYYDYSEHNIINAYKLETIQITSNSDVDEIMKIIDKYKDYYNDLLDQPIPV